MFLSGIAFTFVYNCQIAHYLCCFIIKKIIHENLFTPLHQWKME